MVSNSLHIDLRELLETLKRLRKQYADNAEYRKLRGELPKDWPL
jgi:hypothetical protein